VALLIGSVSGTRMALRPGVPVKGRLEARPYNHRSVIVEQASSLLESTRRVSFGAVELVRPSRERD